MARRRSPRRQASPNQNWPDRLGRFFGKKTFPFRAKPAKWGRVIDMNLTEAQKQTVSDWIAAGAKLSEVQSRLATEFKLTMTYMEVRFLVDDLKLRLKDPEPPKPAPQPPAAQSIPPATPVAESPGDSPIPGGQVSVTVDQLAQPGTLVSGGVTFSDGAQAKWYLDQTGRLGLVAKQQGYKPSPGDIQQFQAALEREMAKLGF